MNTTPKHHRRQHNAFYLYFEIYLLLAFMSDNVPFMNYAILETGPFKNTVLVLTDIYLLDFHVKSTTD